MYTQCTKPSSEQCTICTFCTLGATNGSVIRHVMRDFVHFLCRIVTRVQIVHSRQNHVPNVGFAVPDCPPNYCSKFSEQSVPLHLPNVVQVVWAGIYFPYRLEKCFLFFVRLWVYAAETLTRCVRKTGHLNREKSGVLSHIKELTATWNRGQNLFSLTGWLSQLNL